MQEEQQNTISQMVEDVRAGRMPRRRFIKTLTAMGFSAAGVGAIAAAASSPSVSTRAGLVNAHESTEKHIQLHNQHIIHQSSGNTRALQNDYAETAVVEDSLHKEAFIGRDAIIAREEMITAATSDASITVTNRLAHGNIVVAEWVATGRHTGDLPGLPASGRSFTIPGVTVVIREHDKIVRETLYFDVAELHRQIGHPW
jgi:steroid delta-isomerase-like uncharacterized protein